MLLALLLAGFGTLVPMRWHSGDPKSLDALAGSPVNCVLLEERDWTPAMAVRAADKRFVAMGVVHPAAEFAAVVKHAMQTHLKALVLEGEYEPAVADRLRAAASASDIQVVELPSRGRMRLDSRDPVVGTWQGLWPGIQIEHGGTVSTGPTSAPWINTNTGFLRFVQAATDSTVWVGEMPPPKTVFPVERYALAVADAAIAGARWIVALDEDLEKRLLARESRAIADWKRIGDCIRYFEDRPEWREYRPYSQLAVLQDVASGGLLSSGILDMLSVQHTAARALPASRVTAKSLEGTLVVLNVDASAFTNAGVRVVNPPAGWRFPITAPQQTTPTRKQMDQIQPIWEVAYYATARKNFGARTFNTASIVFNFSMKPDGESALLHLLNYADYISEDVTVHVLGTWRRARLYSLDSPVKDLPVYPVNDGTAVDIARISVLATLRLDR